MAKSAVKYDTLLKPVQDNLLKDWGLSLSIFLTDFMEHLESSDKMNFSEAAMILQNGTAFYCKRVDVVYNCIQEFVTEVCARFSDSADDSAGQKNSNGKKKKRFVKSLEADDLQLLDFVASDHGVDAKINKLVFPGTPQQIVLCSSVKALRKAGTSVTVYCTSDKTLGCKDEFRITGRTYADGTVNEDFNIAYEELISPVDETIEHDDGGPADDSCGGFDDFVGRDNESLPLPDDPIEESPPSEIPQRCSTQAANFSTLGVEPTIPEVVVERCARSKLRRNLVWDLIPNNFKPPIKPLKLGKSAYIPSACLDDDVIKELEELSVKPKKRKRKDKDGKEAVGGVTIRWIDEAIRSGTADRSEFYVLEEKKVRKQLPAIKHKPDDVADPANSDDSIDHVDDLEQDDFEAFQDDNDLISAAPVNRFDARLLEEDRRPYEDEALEAIEKFKEYRRENASRQTEIAERVAKWHEVIMPKLALAETRSHLDVHEYGTKILDMFPDDDPDFILTFHEIVKNEPANEICRYLLATLMLANTYNVEIIKRSAPLINKHGMYCDYVELRLLTKVRHHEEMDEAMRMARIDGGT